MGNKTSHPIHLPTIRPPPKPKINMDALQKTVGIIGGVIALSPIGKLVETGIMTVADIASNGKASEFVNNGHAVNRTLNFVPGGMLAQQLSNDVSNGKTGSTLDKFVPDPMKRVIHDTVKLGETIVLHPSQTINVGKDIGISNVHDLHNIVHNYQDVVIKTKPIVHHSLSDMANSIKKVAQIPHYIHKEEKPHHQTHISPIHSIMEKPHHQIQTILPQKQTTLPQIPQIQAPISEIHTTLSSSHVIIKSEKAPISSYIEPTPISLPIIGLGILCLATFLSR